MYINFCTFIILISTIRIQPLNKEISSYHNFNPFDKIK